MPGSPDQTEELRREIEVHLSYLEDETLQSGGSPRDAARKASERFGNAVEHFRAALEDMSGRQRALRQLMLMAIIGAAIIIVGGSIATVFILKKLESEVIGLRSEFSAAATEINQANVTCMILRAQWDDPPGRPNSLRMPVQLDEWDKWVQSAGLQCGPDEVPTFTWVSNGWVADGYHIRKGVTIWFAPELRKDMSPEAAGTAERAFKSVAAQAQNARCLPRQSVFRAGP